MTDIEFIRLTPTRTRAVTSYAVGSNRFWMLFFPLIRALLRRNYDQLMQEDVPMRQRRGLLRTWGYTFRGDGASRDLRDSIPIGHDNVIPPSPDEAGRGEATAIPLVEITADDWTFTGRSDHLGLKLRREGRRLVAYPRMCPHEGADLDDVTVDDGCLTCPWHGRQLGPLTTLDLDDEHPLAETHWHRLEVEGDRLHIVALEAGSTPPGASPPVTAPARKP